MQFDADDALVEPPVDSDSEFDATAAPILSGPPPLSQTPEAVQEPLGEPGAEEQDTDENIIRPEEFDENHREPFIGLMFIGHLTRTFSRWGHTFTISTPSQLERLEIGQVVQPYQDTISQDLAWMTAFVASYLNEVDGEPLPEPIVKNKKTGLSERFNWVSENLRRPVINELYEECMLLDDRVAEVLTSMGEA